MKLLNILKRKKIAITLESIYIDEVWEEVQKLVNSKKIIKWFIVTPADYDYLKNIYNLKITKSEMANIMAKRYRWMLDKKQELELKLYLTRLANNITKDEQELKIKQALYFMAKGLKIKPSEIMFGWYAYNTDTKDLLKNYNLKLINEKDYSKIYIDYEIIESKYKK
jgi:hypothetical protein